MKTLSQYIQAGQLTSALAFLKEKIKVSPKDLTLRSLLVELLCVQGEYERADQQIETLVVQNPSFAFSGKQLRQLIRAAKHRQEVLMQGRLPQWIEKPNAAINGQVKALTHAIAEKFADAAKEVNKLNKSESALKGSLNGAPFVGLRDLDDRTAYVIELLALNGEYYWVPFNMIKSMVFDASKELISLIWKPVFVTFNNGLEQNFYFPATYVNNELNDLQLLGQETVWAERQGFVQGRGQKMFLIGDDAISANEIKTLQLSN